MTINNSVLRSDEEVIFALRSLYQKYGYFQYKMNKFEEYDFYVQNKDFLVSDNVITFTDTNAKLMALKPDVTLSIVKNISDTPNYAQKLFYNENVYRTTKGTNSFKEIMQTGLEYIGAIDDYAICETVMLAAKSLKTISDDYVMDLSHMGIVFSLADDLNLSSVAKSELLLCISQKNLSSAMQICKNENVPKKKAEVLKQLITLSENTSEALSELENIAKSNESIKDGVALLSTIVNFLSKNGCKENIRIDFSVIQDRNYYNAVVFKGFINGIASAVLVGGQYDMLMKKMGKKSGAVGFAVYLDMLEFLYENNQKYDVDAVLLYDENVSAEKIGDAVRLLSDNKKSVTAQRQIPRKLRFKQLLRLNEKGIEIIENNA